MKEYVKCAKDMLDFIEKSPTCFHAVANISAALEREGYEKLEEREEWERDSRKK